jgi:hypothetical protein
VLATGPELRPEAIDVLEFFRSGEHCLPDTDVDAFNQYMQEISTINLTFQDNGKCFKRRFDLFKRNDEIHSQIQATFECEITLECDGAPLSPTDPIFQFKPHQIITVRRIMKDTVGNARRREAATYRIAPKYVVDDLTWSEPECYCATERLDGFLDSWNRIGRRLNMPATDLLHLMKTARPSG